MGLKSFQMAQFFIMLSDSNPAQMMNSVWLSGDAIASAVTTGLLYNQSHVSGATADAVRIDADAGRGVRHIHRCRVRDRAELSVLSKNLVQRN